MKSLSRIDIALAGFGFVFVVFAILIVWVVTHIRQETELTLQQDIPTSLASLSMLEEFDDMNANVLEFILGESEERIEFYENLEEFKGFRAELHAGEQTAKKIERIDRLIDQYRREVERRIFSVYEPEKELKANDSIKRLILEVGDPLEDLLDKLKEEEIADAGSNPDVEQLVNDDLPGVRYYLELVDEAGDMLSSLDRFVLNDPDAKRAFFNDALSFETYLAELRPLERKPAEIVQLNEVERLFRELKKGGEEIFEIFQASSKVAAVRAVDELEHGNFDMAEQLLENLSAQSRTDAESSMQELFGTLNTTRNIVFVVLLMVTGGIFIYIRSVRRLISDPMTQLAETVNILNKQKLDIEIPYIERLDEVGDVARSLAQFRDSMIEIEELRSMERRSKEALKDERDKVQLAFTKLKEAKESQMSLAEAERNAAQASEAKSQFLANMSHELRTPLNAILGFSQLMSRDPQLNQTQRKNVEVINRSGEHLLSMISDVLDLSKIESGHVEVELEPIDLESMLNDIMEMMSVRALSSGLELTLDPLSSYHRHITSDPGKLRQILINLLGNAIKYTQEGKVTVSLTEKPHDDPQKSWLLVKVTDTGIGIAAEEAERVFQPFEQVSGYSRTKGTGLGLAISRHFISLMGGKISLKSEPGVGSEFYFEIPVVVDQSPSEQASSVTKGEVVGLAPGQEDFRILVVDDQIDNRALLSQLLTGIGFYVEEAENGQLAVEMFQQWQPHLIWMDFRMPVMDGLQATAAIRQLPGGDKVKIVTITASVFMDQRDKAFAAGCDGFICKPFRNCEIFNCMEELLGLKYLYQQAPQAAIQTATKHEDEDFSNQELTENLLEEMMSLSVEQLQQLSDVALELEPAALKKEIEQLPNPQLVERLLPMVDDFQYEAILGLCEQALQQKQ